MFKIFVLLLISLSVWAQSPTACDLNGDGVVNAVDISLATSMVLGQTPCTSTIEANPSKCTVISLQRVFDASQGQACITYNTHNLSLNWSTSIVNNIWGAPSSFVTGSTGWNIFRSNVSGGPYTQLNSTPIGLTASFLETNVIQGSTNYYVFTDTIPTGQSPLSAQVTYMTEVIAGYNVYRSITPSGTVTKVNPNIVTAIVYQDTAVVAGQTYYYVVRSVNTSNMESANSIQVSGTIPIP